MKIVQGDIVFVRIDKLPGEVKVKKDGVIAEGEATGHFHQLKEKVEMKDSWTIEEALKHNKALVLELGGDMFVQTKEDTTIVHNEHKPIILPKGTYKVKRTREYVPGGWRKVED